MKSLKVLVADDKEKWRWAGKRFIEEYTKWYREDKSPLVLELKEVETPEQANQLITNFYPDLIILDVCFGDGSNRDWINKFLKPYREANGKAKIICWSENENYEWDVKKAGANEFINKSKSNYMNDAIIVQLETFGDYKD